MANVADLKERLTDLVRNQVVLTPAQLRQEAVFVYSCIDVASISSALDVVQLLFMLFIGDTVDTSTRDELRYSTWISGSEDDRINFLTTFHCIAEKLCNDYHLEGGLIDVAKHFIEFGSLRGICLSGAESFLNAAENNHVDDGEEPTFSPVDHALITFCHKIASVAMETLTKILTIASVAQMRAVVDVDHEYLIDEVELLYYRTILSSTGAVNDFFITGHYYKVCIEWVALWMKVNHTSSMDYLYYKAPSPTCICGKVLNSASACVIMDSCYDLLCVQCANRSLSTRVNRKCPACHCPTKNWMSSDSFKKLKTSMKKRKNRFPQPLVQKELCFDTAAVGSSRQVATISA